MGQKQCIRPDGKLDDSFILTYLTQNNKRAAHDYIRILAAFNKLKENDPVLKGNRPKVSDKTLKKFVFFSDAVVRPLDTIFNSPDDFLYIGEILKLPEKKSTRDYDDSEAWKALIETESRCRVGDKIIYGFKANVVLDDELLHLVWNVTGRIIE